MSIHSTNSTSSKFGSSIVRKAFPPGLAERINQSQPPSQSQPQAHSQSRYMPTTDRTESQSHPEHPPLASFLPSTSPQAQQRMETVSPGHRSISNSTTSNNRSPLFQKPTQAHSPAQLQVPASELNLPSESNLSNFCKGAIRLQLGSRKKGFSLEHRRSGTHGTSEFWRCTKCSFAGPATVSAALPSGGRAAVKREKAFDNRVWLSEGGIKYRWAFLAKCHVLNKTEDTNPKKHDDISGIFGCVFCSAEGSARGWEVGSVSAQLTTLGGFTNDRKQASITPLFPNLQSFMAHLEMHREAKGTPGLIMASRMNCIVGRVADDSEDFDLNLPPL
jgi:hypothetical protein